MSNKDDLLKEIGAGLETLAARINVSLATTDPADGLDQLAKVDEDDTTICPHCYAVFIADTPDTDPRLKCGSPECPAYAGGGRCKNTEKCTASTELPADATTDEADGLDQNTRETLLERYPGACLASCDVVTGCRSRITITDTSYSCDGRGFCGQPRVCSLRTVLELARTAVAPMACLTPCDTTTNCSYVRARTCLRPLICEDHIPIDDTIDKTCYSPICSYRAAHLYECAEDKPCANQLKGKAPVDGEADTAATAPAGEYRIWGYTLEQWGTIRDGGYLCEFAPDDVFHKGQTYLDVLTSLDRPVPGLRTANEFISESHGAFNRCRPAQIPGVLRPWFGGECPVADDTRVLITLRCGSSSIISAGFAMWGHGDEGLPANESEIIAYMEV